MATVASLVWLFGGRCGSGLPLTGSFLGPVGLSFHWPDFAAFVPIALGRRAGSWPRWGAALDEVFHSLLTGIAVFAIWSALTETLPWPLRGWALHLSADRSFGDHLRAPGHRGTPQGPRARSSLPCVGAAGPGPQFPGALDTVSPR